MSRFDPELDLEPGVSDTDHVTVRSLTLDDLDAVIRVDEAATGARRTDFYSTRIERSLSESSIHLSLAAEVDGIVVGFVMVTFFQGEFGLPEAVAVLDAIGVHPEYRGKRVGRALMRQLEMNLSALRVESLRTEAGWDAFELLAFLSREGFTPAPRICLEKRL